MKRGLGVALLVAGATAWLVVANREAVFSLEQEEPPAPPRAVGPRAPSGAPEALPLPAPAPEVRESLPAASGEPASAGGRVPLADVDAPRRALQAMQRELFARLDDVRWRVAHCDLSGSTLLLTLESLEGAVRIADAQLEPLPAAEDPRTPAAPAEGAVHCVRSGLVGNVLAAPGSVPGRRWEMPFDPGPAG